MLHGTKTVCLISNARTQKSKMCTITDGRFSELTSETLERVATSPQVCSHVCDYNGMSTDLGTEFLDDVGWQLEPWASLNDATGFHIGEGRWLRDRRFSDDYLNHMYNGGNDRHFVSVKSIIRTVSKTIR